MFGALEFYELCKKSGIKPIIGCEVYLAPRSRFDRQGKVESSGNGDEDRNYHLVLLAKNLTGYKNLMQLVTLSYLEGFYYKPRIDKDILRQYHEGLIGLSGCLKGEIATLLMRNQEQAARKAALEYAEIFGAGNFYLELQANGLPSRPSPTSRWSGSGVNSVCLLSPRTIATTCARGDARAHEMLLCIQTGKTVLDEKRMKFQTEQLYFKSPEEMFREFADVPGCPAEHRWPLLNSVTWRSNWARITFPCFHSAAEKALEECFERTVREGFRRAHGEPFAGSARTLERGRKTEYRKRLRL